MRRLGFSFVLVVGSLSCGGSGPTTVTPPPTSKPPELAQKVVSLKDAGIDPDAMNRSADACQDFYELACGTLVKTVEIPGDENGWGPSQELTRRTEEFLRDTLEQAKKAPADDPAMKKIGAWYAACTDEEAIEKAGIKPLEPLFAITAKVTDKKTLYAAVTELHKRHIFPIFDVSSQQDFKDATLVIAGLDQDGLGLPDRDYYLGDCPAAPKDAPQPTGCTDATMREQRAFYVGHVERMFGLAGDKPAAAKKGAADVMRIETALAKLAQDKVVRRDPKKVYNPVDRKGLAAMAPAFAWDAYFAGIGFPDVHALSVNSVDYFKGVDALMTSEPADAWRNYLRWKVLEANANRLGKAFIEERFKFRQKFTGETDIIPRWKRCVRSTDDALGELLGQTYVKARFDAQSKDAALATLHGVREAMKSELGALPWMDPTTVAAAQEKLGKMNEKIGYPEKWKAYDYDVSPKDYASNALASDAFELARNLKKIGKPVDRRDWQMTPPTNNAYYDASLNEMVFPAGILQPPFFDKRFTAAVNFGETGGTMGHELTHGFDDEGSQFDGDGNLRNWWSAQTGDKFKAQTQCVSDQYSRYEAVPGVKLNGDLTLGENVADIGGLKLAYAAYKAARKGATERLVADGYTEDQVFFIAYGQSWCEKDRPEYLDSLAKNNPHSPAKWRVNGVVSDVPAFAEAFSCKVGAPMRPEKTCAVW
jgi:putative endopeptidase